MVFTADNSIESGGFEAAYSSGAGAGVPASPAPAFASTASSPGPCSGTTTLSSPAGTITDGPGIYSPNQNCQFSISTGSWITLTFSSLATEANYDFVKVYDGASSSSPLLGSFSGITLPGAVTASSGSMYVVFTADNSIEGGGFDAAYSSVVSRRSDRRNREHSKSDDLFSNQHAPSLTILVMALTSATIALGLMAAAQMKHRYEERKANNPGRLGPGHPCMLQSNSTHGMAPAE